MNNEIQFLSAQRLTAVVQSLQDVRELPQELLFSRMHPVVNATEAEIIARWFVRAQIADIVVDDGRAAVYNYGRFQTETVNLPNLKFGINLNQATLALLNTLKATNPQVAQSGGLSPLMSLGEMLLLGIRQRWESLFVAAYIDSFSYNRYGVKLTGTTFGTPTDLKVTTSPTWDTAATAQPVNDILTLLQIGRQRYGIVYDRMIIPTPAWQYLIATADFISRIRAYYGINATVTGATLGLGVPGAIEPQQWAALSAPVLGLKEIVFYDARYWTQAEDGSVASARHMPANQVILCSSANDMQPGVLDMANAETVESQVMGLVPTNIMGELPPGQYGPIAYATPSDPNLNPPGITAWGVARSWPRKWLQQMNAALTVGTFGDIINTGVPFPIA